MDMSPFEDLESAAARLEASGAYRVLRRLEPRRADPELRPPGSRLGVVLDVETTGMDCARDEVIELAMVRFVYSPEGEVLGVQDTFQALHQPTQPIPAEIRAITGIDDAMVAGHKLDLDAIGGFVAPAQIVLAHNAGFDRGFAERLHAYFSSKPWGCSMCEPPWREEGFEGQKLAYLAAESGFFYNRHRALNDCMATLELLAPASPAQVEPGWRRCSPRRASRAGGSGPTRRLTSSKISCVSAATAGATVAMAALAPGGSRCTTPSWMTRSPSYARRFTAVT